MPFSALETDKLFQEDRVPLQAAAVWRRAGFSPGGMRTMLTRLRKGEQGKDLSKDQVIALQRVFLDMKTELARTAAKMQVALDTWPAEEDTKE